ncbi:hypothetical protein SETIT_9G306100v2 [Setaria italica]|uniref:Uncharacterized protein n=1 Tax=Setaria italica TaxID=4555 RepID=A0A368SME2_SETIT|nr:hypothetical protein SETIT_9G306100v2 [Setaria italica]
MKRKRKLKKSDGVLDGGSAREEDGPGTGGVAGRGGTAEGDGRRPARGGEAPQQQPAEGDVPRQEVAGAGRRGRGKGAAAAARERRRRGRRGGGAVLWPGGGGAAAAEWAGKEGVPERGREGPESPAPPTNLPSARLAAAQAACRKPGGCKEGSGGASLLRGHQAWAPHLQPWWLVAAHFWCPHVQIHLAPS